MTTTPALIFGAGKTGRGLAARICTASNRGFILVDRDAALVAELSAAGAYPLTVLGQNPGAGTQTVRPLGFHAIAGDAWVPAFAAADLCFTAVFGNNLAALGVRLAAALRGRQRPLNIITCENLAHAAKVLREAVATELSRTDSPAECARVLGLVGFVEAMVLTTCLSPAEGGHRLQIRTQDLLCLPCDGDAFIGAPPALRGLEPLPRFAHQLVRKIYTYNCINAVVTYLGAARGYEQLAEAANDPAIAPVAVQAGIEASRALVATYGFDEKEQRTWADDAMAKFRDRDIPDPISRNGADPARKLAQDDRLIGPALMALGHGVEPTAIITGILAAADFHDEGKPSLREKHGSLAAVLVAVCRLPADAPLHRLVIAADAARSSTAALSHGR